MLHRTDSIEEKAHAIAWREAEKIQWATGRFDFWEIYGEIFEEALREFQSSEENK
jgi:hypothetical protein